jgi:hypothetical protein
MSANSMSALGQKETSDRRTLMSAIHPKADIELTLVHVRVGPKADMAARVECTFRGNSHLTKVVRVARRDQNAALQKPRGHLKNAL